MVSFHTNSTIGDMYCHCYGMFAYDLLQCNLYIHIMTPCSLTELSSILFLEVSLTMLPLQLQPYPVLCLILKHYRAETGTISQRVRKVRSSSEDVLRSCFYILLLSRVHKSLFCRTPGHLLRSLSGLEAIAAQVCSSPPSGNCLFLLCHSYNFLSFGILYHRYNSAQTSSHECPLSATRTT